MISTISVQGELTQTLLKQLIHLVYDVRRDDAPLRKVAGIKGEFDKLRKFYPVRREWSSLEVYYMITRQRRLTQCYWV